MGAVRLRCAFNQPNRLTMKTAKTNTAAATHVEACGTPWTRYHVHDILKSGHETFVVTKIERARMSPWHVETVYWLKDKHGVERWGLQSIVEAYERTYDAAAHALAQWKRRNWEFSLWMREGNYSEEIATYPNGAEAFAALEKLAADNGTEVVFENGTEFGAEPACWAWGVCVNEKSYYLTVEG